MYIALYLYSLLQLNPIPGFNCNFTNLWCYDYISIQFFFFIVRPRHLNIAPVLQYSNSAHPCDYSAKSYIRNKV